MSQDNRVCKMDIEKYKIEVNDLIDSGNWSAARKKIREYTRTFED